jgi:hypothetical protein
MMGRIRDQVGEIDHASTATRSAAISPRRNPMSVRNRPKREPLMHLRVRQRCGGGRGEG